MATSAAIEPGLDATMREDSKLGAFHDARQLRRLWFAYLSQAADAHLRSTWFLEWAKYTRKLIDTQELLARRLTHWLSNRGSIRSKR
jgi:hypothetical protein